MSIREQWMIFWQELRIEESPNAATNIYQSDD